MRRWCRGEKRLAREPRDGLRDAGFAWDLSRSTVRTRAGKLPSRTYDGGCSDRDLPGVHGDDVCPQPGRPATASRILMPPAAADVDDRVARLGSCDDTWESHSRSRIGGAGSNRSRRSPIGAPVVATGISRSTWRGEPCSVMVGRCF